MAAKIFVHYIVSELLNIFLLIVRKPACREHRNVFSKRMIKNRLTRAQLTYLHAWSSTLRVLEGSSS